MVESAHETPLLEAPSFGKLAKEGVVENLLATPYYNAQSPTETTLMKKDNAWTQCLNMGNGVKSFKSPLKKESKS